MKTLKINGEAFTLKPIKEDSMTKHGESVEYMVYDADGEFVANASVIRKLHHSCKEKGYEANDGVVYDNLDEAVFASVAEKTDYDANDCWWEFA